VTTQPYDAVRVEELVGRRIREARERSGMSQQELGQWLGPLLGRELPRQAVSLAEQGKRQFSAVELVAFAFVVGCDVGSLFTPPPEVESLELPGKPISRQELRDASKVGERPTQKAVEQALAKFMRQFTQAEQNMTEAGLAARELHNMIEEASDAA
jgi:transcriptional regulator with XRE-family HTH domain